MRPPRPPTPTPKRSRNKVGVVAALPQLHGEVHQARPVLHPLLPLEEEGRVLLVDGAVVLLLDLR